jgi:hypothetical protein
MFFVYKKIKSANLAKLTTVAAIFVKCHDAIAGCSLGRKFRAVTVLSRTTLLWAVRSSYVMVASAGK